MADKPDYTKIIGTKVHGKIDRPVGCRHPRCDIWYTVNYGYVEGVTGGDGAEQDVYVLGTDEPLETFKGTVIAVYHRTNDVEDKWIVSLDGRDYSDEEILSKIHFVEQYFEGYLCRSDDAAANENEADTSDDAVVEKAVVLYGLNDACSESVSGHEGGRNHRI